MPLLMRRLPHEIVKTLTAEQINNEFPADVYTYGHYSWNEKARELGTTYGKRVLFYGNMLTVREEFINGTWAHHYWNIPLMEVCDDAGAWVKKDGQYVSGRWKPGRIVDLGKLSVEHIDFLLDTLEAWHDDYWMDLCYTSIPSWLLPDGVTLEDLDDYVPMRYLVRMQQLISGMQTRGIFGFCNGDRKLAYQGFPVMYENIDTQHQETMWANVAQWLTPVCEGSVLSTETSFANLWEIMRLWVKTDKILDCQNIDAARSAWELKKGVGDE